MQIPHAQDSTSRDTDCAIGVSLLTCTPGAELYSTFGHSALRVVDHTAGTDSIYNYGTFDFEDPSFYSKFVRGKLLYFVSVEPYAWFVEQYQYEQRGILEQKLRLSCEETKRLLAFLHENLRPENRYYKYDFVYDNCTTRLRDIVFSNLGPGTRVADIRPAPPVTFRDLIHSYLDRAHQNWSKLGIDILLGSPLDKRLLNNETMFLPDYLLKGFDSTQVKGGPLVSEKAEVLSATAPPPDKPVFTPIIVFGIVLLLIAIASLSAKARRMLFYFDAFLFLTTGLLGLLLLFMWFGTDHQTCRNNFNLAWAFPVNLALPFFLSKKRPWLKRYCVFYMAMLALLLLSWVWLPQEMNNALLPIVSLLLIRTFILYKKQAYAS